jgi:CheY-like chemotaxis protein
LAHDGIAAVECAASFQPHVVLLDIGLPRLNGYDAARRIRSQSGLQPVLVALTGWGQAEDRRKAADAGFDAHLLKPVDHDELTNLIAAVPAAGQS